MIRVSRAAMRIPITPITDTRVERYTAFILTQLPSANYIERSYDFPSTPASAKVGRCVILSGDIQDAFLQILRYRVAIDWCDRGDARHKVKVKKLREIVGSKQKSFISLMRKGNYYFWSWRG
jgi:hypothetical protein